MGVVYNPTYGGQYGAVYGLGSDEGFVPVPGVSLDTLARKHVPATAGEWTTLLAAAGIASGGPSLLWLCQEAAGNLADSIGTFTGTVSGATLTYRGNVTGWTRKDAFIGGATCMVRNTDAGLPDVATTSALTFGYYLLAGSAATLRNYAQVGTTLATASSLTLTAGGRAQILCGANSAFGPNPVIYFNQVIPYVLRVNRTNNTATAFTNQESIPVTFDASITGKAVTVGGDGVLANPPWVGGVLYFAEFFGAAAELTDVQIQSLLRKAGW